jgi:hypothetical protein
VSFRVVSKRRYPAVTASDAMYALLDNSRTADVWASEVVAQWQQQQQLAADNGTLNKVGTQAVMPQSVRTI